MKLVVCSLTLIFFLKFSHAGKVTLQYGEDTVIDCMMTYWPYCYGDEESAAITYYKSNGRWERYYYKIPIPIILKEYPADSIFFSVYKQEYSYSNQEITLTVNRLIENLSSSFEYLVGNYKSPSYDDNNLDTSLTIIPDYEGWIKFNITDLVNNWAFEETENFGLVIRMLNENDVTDQSTIIYQSLSKDILKRPKIEAFAPFLPDTLLTSTDFSTSIRKRIFKNPNNFEIYNYPNPFNPETTIKYNLPTDQLVYPVKIKIYDALAKLLITLKNERQNPGMYTVKWNGKNTAGRNMPSGIYFCMVDAGQFKAMQKMLLVR